MQDATISGTGEQVVLVGAASKGIIQRGFQHNAMVYKTPYAKNPFDAITDQELDQYKREIERKQKGDPYDESQSESEALSSFNISRATHESSTAKSPIQSPVSVTSETEEESRDEPRVLRIETKQVPAPSQPEVVLSDGENTVNGDHSDAHHSTFSQSSKEVCSNNFNTRVIARCTTMYARSHLRFSHLSRVFGT
jgi:adducin